MFALVTAKEVWTAGVECAEMVAGRGSRPQCEGSQHGRVRFCPWLRGGLALISLQVWYRSLQKPGQEGQSSRCPKLCSLHLLP